MLSLANISSSGAATHYYENDDYYAKDSPEHKESSEWFGKGAEKLGLKGSVEKSDFKDILDGNLPNGGKLGRKEGDKVIHAPGIDATFSAPKSVSIQAEVYGDKKIYEAHKKAVLKTLEYVEKNLVQTRKWANGKLIYENAHNMTAALFRHNTSRNQDPQLHTHCIFANVVQRKDGQWRSAYFGKVFDNKLFLGQLYRSELAYELIQLGYELRITGKNSSFELKEIPDNLIKLFSTRAQEIEAAADGFEVVDAKLKAKLTLKTRDYKKDVDRETLQSRWQEVVKEYDAQLSAPKNDNPLVKDNNFRAETGRQKVFQYFDEKWQQFCEKFASFGFGRVPHIDEERTKDSRSIEDKAVGYAIRHISERSTVWEEKDMIAVALSYGTGRTTFEKIQTEIARYKQSGQLLIAKTQLKDYEMPLTTNACLSKEIKTIELMREGKNKVTVIYTKDTIQENLSNTNLNQGQKEAVALILGTKDRIVGVQGYAGVGKTYMLQHARALLTREGYRIIGMAPSSSAAKTLENDAGIKSGIMHKFLFRYDGVVHDRGTEAGRIKMRQDFKNTVLIVDEASLASTSQIYGLLKIAKELDIRVVLVGDTKQLNAVEAGKPFYQLQRAGMQTAIMGEIVRQDKSPKLKSAVYDSINGNIEAALHKIGKDVIEVRSIAKSDHRLNLADAAAREWMNLPALERNNAFVTAPSHIIRTKINETIRTELKVEGVLKGQEYQLSILESKGLTQAQSSHIDNYQQGDNILFNKAYKSLGINKGDYLLVSEIKGDSGVVVLEKNNGKRIGWQPDKIAGNRSGAIEVFEKKSIVIQEGEQLRWTKNSSSNSNIINSGTCKINSINDKQLTATLESGEVLKLNLKDNILKHIDYAYASTIHAAQGKTFDKVIGVIEAEHPHLTTQKAFYVTLSRARYSAILITDNKDQLAKTLIAKAGERVAATEHQGMKYSKIIASDYVRDNNISNHPQHQASKAAQRISHKIESIYSAMYSRIPKVLPEFGFENKGSCYVSTTERKIDGSVGKKGKVYIYSNNPGVLIDYTKGNKSIWDYVKDNHIPSATKAELYEYLTDAAGLITTKSSAFTPAIVTEPSRANTKTKSPEVQVDKKLLTDIHNLSQNLLFRDDNHALVYLKQDRGYDEGTIRKMELGFISSKKAVGQCLKGLGWSDEKIKEAYKTLGLIGQTHKLVIPYKDKNGELIGFAARNIFYKDSDNFGKYLYSKGLSKSDTLFNIHNTKGKNLLIVEGLFDCLHASAKGISNVAALGGTSFNNKQMELIQSKGIDKLTICLDQDNAGKEATQRIMEVVSKASSNIELKGVTLPKGVKDPDQLLREQGLEALRISVASAQPIQLHNTLQTNQASNYKANHVILDNKKAKAVELEVER